MEPEINYEMVEKQRILRRYLHYPLYDDADLYYNGLIDSTECLDHKSDYSYKIVVFNTLMSRLLQNKHSEKEAINKPSFPIHIPRSKRSPNRKIVKNLNWITAVVESQKNPCVTQKQSELLLSPKQTPRKGFRLNIKFEGNIVFSVARSAAGTALIQENRPEKKRPNNEHGSDFIKPKKWRITEYEPHAHAKIIPAKLKARLQREDTILVIKKTLTPTDVNNNNTRLSIPELQIVNHGFLTKEEVLWLSKKDGKALRHMDVRLVDPSGKKWDIKLAKWLMNKNVIYNLISPWKEVVAENKLRENTPIEVYSYRKGTKIYFAVIRV